MRDGRSKEKTRGNRVEDKDQKALKSQKEGKVQALLTGRELHLRPENPNPCYFCQVLRMLISEA
jgi:hypothetical protein